MVMNHMESNIEIIKNDFDLVYKKLNAYSEMIVSSTMIIAFLILILVKKSKEIDTFGHIALIVVGLGCLYFLIGSLIYLRSLIKFKNRLIEQAKPYHLTSKVKLNVMPKVVMAFIVFCGIAYAI